MSTIGLLSRVNGTSAGTQEIARNVEQAARGTSQVTTHITDVNRGASETGPHRDRCAPAQSLAGESSHLKSGVAKFLQPVRGA